MQVYYAYDIIHNSVLSPFKATHPMTLFNCARFLLMRTLTREAPPGVSMVHVVYTLATQVQTYTLWLPDHAAALAVQQWLLPT
jgi:hypothetical protein